MITLIKNGTVVLPEKTIKADIKIEDETIVLVEENISSHADKIIDATGLYVFAGGIDAHTHFDLDTGTTKTADDFFTGSRASIVGGTTTFIDFATQQKGKSLKFAKNEWDEKSSGKTFCDFGYHMAIVDWNEEIKAEMAEMVSDGITSFKLYMAYKGSLQVDDGVIYEALKESAKVGGLIGFHCENGDLISVRTNDNLKIGNTSPFYHKETRPNLVESEAINRLISIAKLANAPAWVVHLSTHEGLLLIKSARQDGIQIVAETCPQYLLLDESVYGTKEDTSFEAAKYVISPPIRSKNDSEKLWNGITDKTIDFISTDHCSFNFKGQKELGKNDYSKIPNGGPGVEHRFILMYTYGVLEGKLSLNELTKILSYNPAKTFGLDSKGSLEAGKDADIVLYNPNGKYTITAKNQTQNVDYTPYENFEVSGKIEKVFLRGKEIVSDGKIIEDKAFGKFIKRSKSGYHKS